MRLSTKAGNAADCSLNARDWCSTGGRRGRTLTGTSMFCEGIERKAAVCGVVESRGAAGGKATEFERARV
eukprot:2743015-Pleurochrysis_carterae.AAC.1